MVVNGLTKFFYGYYFSSSLILDIVTLCAIWYHLYNLKNMRNIHGGVLLLVITKSSTPPWVFFTFLKLYKWYQIYDIYKFGGLFLSFNQFLFCQFTFEDKDRIKFEVVLFTKRIASQFSFLWLGDRAWTIQNTSLTCRVWQRKRTNVK